MKKVSIIVPIYNAEKYIQRCIVSLFEQDFSEIEYIFVNDGTTDKSIDILQKNIEKYPKRKADVKIIHHEKNKGSGASRRTGIKNATGEYTIQIDSDDWCDLRMISSLYAKAQETNADIVVCDYFNSFKDKNVYQKQNYSCCLEEDLSKMLMFELAPAIWNKLIKRTLYTENKIYPPKEISTAEDRWLMVRLFLAANSIAYLPEAYYYYWRENTVSLSTKIGDKLWNDIEWYSKTTQKFLEEKGLFNTYGKYFYIGNLKEVLVLSRGRNYKQNINKISPEADRLKYLYQIPRFNYLIKFIYSLSILNLGFLVRFLLILKTDILYEKLRKLG